MPPSFPIFLRRKGDARVKRFFIRKELTRHLEAIDLENDEFEAWDKAGFRIALRLGIAGNINSLELIALGNEPAIEEAMQAFEGFAAAQGASISLPRTATSLLGVFKIANYVAYEAWKKKPWIKRFLERF
jgi:hypothetical protein